MDSRQPGKISKFSRFPDDQEAAEKDATDEISQIDSAVQSMPPQPEGHESADTKQPPPDTQTPTDDPVSQERAEPAHQPEFNDQLQDNTAGAAGDDELLLSWQSHGDAHQRGPQWYIGLFALSGILAAAMALMTGSWMSAVVVVLAVVALVTVNIKGPKAQAYGIFTSGIQIEDRFYSFDQLRSFSLSSQNGGALIELEPSKRFMPRITMHAGDNADQAQELLTEFLPRDDREPDMIDKLSQRLKL